MSDWDAATAEWYAAKYGEYPTNRLAVDALDFATDATVVDVGCGTGAALRHVAKYVTSGALLGIDPVPRMIELAREKTSAHPASGPITFFEGSAEAIPLEDARADVVFAFDSFDHWSDKQAGLAEVRRILRPHGRFVVVKDGGLPHGKKVRQVFIDALQEAGFQVVHEQQLAEGKVTATLWTCAIADPV